MLCKDDDGPYISKKRLRLDKDVPQLSTELEVATSSELCLHCSDGHILTILISIKVASLRKHNNVNN